MLHFFVPPSNGTITNHLAFAATTSLPSTGSRKQVLICWSGDRRVLLQNTNLSLLCSRKERPRIANAQRAAR